MRWRFWKRAPVETPAPPIPESHKRVMVWADSLNNSLTQYGERRLEVLAELQFYTEELRQLDAIMAANRASLAKLIDDPSLQFAQSQAARHHIDEGDELHGIEAELAKMPLYDTPIEPRMPNVARPSGHYSN